MAQCMFEIICSEMGTYKNELIISTANRIVQKIMKRIKPDVITGLLTDLRHIYLFNVHEDGETKTSLKDIMEVWDKVNQVISK